MHLKYNDAQHREYLYMTERVGLNWLEVFQGKEDFYSAAYWDLFTRIWKNGGPVRKTDALKFMTGIRSAQTAGKYLDTALRHGYLQEEENPSDARSRLVCLSPEMKERLDGFFDLAVSEVRKSAHTIQSL